MKIGLVGYFNFGNYGDELFVDVFKSLFDQSDLTILNGVDGIHAHDPNQIGAQDCIIVGGGDLVIPSGYAERYWSRSLLSRPVFIVGVGVADGSAVSPAAVRHMRRFFQDTNVRLVTARDTRSRDWIVEHLQPRVPVGCYPDLVAGMDFAKTESTGRTLGLVLRPHPAMDGDSLEALVARAYGFGYRVKQLVLGIGAMATEDLAAAKALDLPFSDLVVRDSIEDLTRELSRCDVVVSQRFHGCVAAMMMGIPTIGIGRSNKFTALFEMFEKEPFLVAPEDTNLALRLIDPMYTISATAVARVQKDAREGLMEVRQAVTGEHRRRRRRRRHGHYGDYGGGDYGGYGGYGGYGHLGSKKMRRARERDRSPRLRANPGSRLHPGEELSWYRGAVAARKGAAYVSQLDDIVDATPELASLPHGTKAVVTIPIAGVTEHENIYGTLSLYAQQGEAALRATTVIAYVNYADSATSDRSTWSAIQSTLAGIDRARADFPALRIAVVDEPFPRATPAQHNGIIGYVARRMYDLALLSVERAMRAGGLDPDQDVLLIRNDADAIGMCAGYLDRLIRAADRHFDADAFQGAVRWGTPHTCDYPGFGVVVSFKEGLRALTARVGSPYRVRPSTTGSNVAVRMSTLAAVGSVGTTDYYGAGADDLEIGIRVHEARARQGASSLTNLDRRGADGLPRTIRFVPGAQIDASGERSFATYSSGESITATWSTFNAGADGYTARIDAAGATSVTPGSIDLDASIDRIERNVEDLASSWYADPELVDSALRLVIGRTVDGLATYDRSWHGGRFSFAFTSAGRSWLKRRLHGDGGAGVEPYWRRTMRSLYGGPVGVATSQISRRPRMVASLTSGRLPTP